MKAAQFERLFISANSSQNFCKKNLNSMFKHCIFVSHLSIMTETLKKKSPLLKKIITAAVILLVAGAGIYWYIATEKFSDTKDRKAAFTVNAGDFIKEFETDINAANAKYAEKIVTVNGIISATETADTTINIKMTDTATGSYIIFAFQDQHLDEAKTLKAGDVVSIKGSCSGAVYSDILGFYSITFKRSALNK